jgi:hypothetical protein
MPCRNLPSIMDTGRTKFCLYRANLACHQMSRAALSPVLMSRLAEPYELGLYWLK